MSETPKGYDADPERKVKPALKKHPLHSGDDTSGDNKAVGVDGQKKKKKALKWDGEAIEEHDLLRGTRMKVRAVYRLGTLMVPVANRAQTFNAIVFLVAVTIVIVVHVWCLSVF